jgi:hypothetical protein
MAKKSKSFWDKFKDSVMSMGDETAGPAKKSTRKAKPKKAAAKKRSTAKAKAKPKAKKRTSKKKR